MSQQKNPQSALTSPQTIMARASNGTLVDNNGPGSAATSIAESVVKPADAAGGRTKCIESVLVSLLSPSLAYAAIGVVEKIPVNAAAVTIASIANNF